MFLTFQLSYQKFLANSKRNTLKSFGNLDMLIFNIKRCDFIFTILDPIVDYSWIAGVYNIVSYTALTYFIKFRGENSSQLILLSR